MRKTSFWCSYLGVHTHWLGTIVSDLLLPWLQLKALLHGHSYTAHAMGCTAAVKSIKWFKDPQTNSNITSEGRLLREVCESVLLCFYFLLFLDLCFAGISGRCYLLLADIPGDDLMSCWYNLQMVNSVVWMSDIWGV